MVRFVIKNKIGLGAVVQIIRSGDVIQKLRRVIKPALNIKMPINMNLNGILQKKI